MEDRRLRIPFSLNCDVVRTATSQAPQKEIGTR